MKQKRLHLLFVVIVFIQVSVAHSQVDTLKEKLKFDFGFTRSNNINIWPIFKKVSTPSYKETDILFPLFMKKADESKSWRYSHFAPIYFNSRTPAYKDFRLLSVYYPSLFHYRKDSNEVKSVQLLEILPRFSLMDVRKSPRGVYIDQNFLFFIWFKKDVLLQKSHFVVFPFSWYFRDKENRSYTFFPLFSKGNFDETRYLALTPLYWHFKNRAMVSNTIFPLFHQQKSWYNGNKNQGTVIFPLFWDFRDDQRITRILFPVYWDFKTPGYRNVTVFPFFSSGHTIDNTRKYFAVTPLYWNKNHKAGYSRTLFPVLWNSTRYRLRDTLKTNILFPLWWDFSSKRFHNSLLFPVYGKFIRQNYRSTTVMPFYSTGISNDGKRRHYAISPLYWNFSNPTSRNSLFFPIWFHRKDFSGKDTVKVTIFSLLWWTVNEEKSHVSILFPVFWDFRSPDYCLSTLFPLYYYQSQKAKKELVLRITPLFHYVTKNDMLTHTLLPVWWYRKSLNESKGLKEFVVFPFYWSIKDKKIRTKIYFPLYWDYKDSIYHSTTVFPLFSVGKSKDNEKKHTALTPLYWDFRNQNYRLTSIFPIYWRGRALGFQPVKKTDFIFPFYYSETSAERKFRAFFPLIWYKRNNSLLYHAIFPLYFYSSSPDTRNFQLLLLLYHYRKQIDKSVYNSLLWKTVYWSKYQDGGHEFRFLYLLFADVDKRDLIEKSYFPFYYYSKIKNTNEYQSWFFYFFSKSKNYLPEVHDYYIEERIFWFLRLRSNYNILEKEGKARFLKQKRGHFK